MKRAALLWLLLVAPSFAADSPPTPPGFVLVPLSEAIRVQAAIDELNDEQERLILQITKLRARYVCT